jgi:transketolase
VVTLENHVITERWHRFAHVAEIMADQRCSASRLVRLGLKDTYAHGGSRGYLMKHTTGSMQPRTGARHRNP